MTQRVPQIIVTLSPQGDLIIELPGAQATRRQVQVRAGEFAQTCLRILQAQLNDQTEIGLDGAPTQAQVRHWERHQIWPDSHCRFCLSEGRAHPDHKRVARRELISVDRSGVEVRKIKSGVGSAKTSKARKTAEELGL